MSHWNPIAMELAGSDADGAAVIGGAADTIGYEKSRATKAKKEVVKRLARALKNAGAPVSVGDGDSMAQMVAAIKKAIPDPRSSTYQTDAGKHKSACASVAAQLNKEFNPTGDAAANPIPTHGDARDICQGVAEFVHSLGTGIQAEFADVYAEIKKVVKNLVVVGEVMERVAEDLAAPSADTPELRKQRKAQIDRLTAENTKQLKTLENLLAAQMADADLELEAALADLNETDGLVKDLGLQVGTDEFSYALARVVASAGTLAALTEKVDKALKKAGISMEAFRKADTIEKARKLFDEKFEGVSAEKMQDFMEARAEIEKYFEMHRDLSGKLGGESGFVDVDGDTLETTDVDADMGADAGGMDSSTGGYTPDMSQYENIDSDGAVGGAVGVVASKDDKYDKRTQLLKAGRDQLMKQFAKDATAAIKEVNAAVEKVSDHLGETIPINAHTVRMRNAIKALCDMDYLATAQQAIMTLEGASAGQREDRAIAVQKIASAVQAIQNARTGLSGEADRALSDLEMAVAVFEKVVDRYTNAAQALVKRDIQTGGDVTAQTCGGDEGDVTVLQSDMRKAIGRFVYNFYTAKVKQNIVNSAKLLDVFSAKYQDRMAQAVGAIQSQIRDLGGKVDPKLKPAADALENFWRTLFALDDYMLLYTKDIAAHVKDVRQIDQMLDDVVLIRDWAKEDMVAALNAVAGAGDIEAKRKEAKVAMKKYGGLKNIVSAFARIGSKFAGQQIRSKAMMNEADIYRALQAFLTERLVMENGGDAVGTAGAQRDAAQALSLRFGEADEWFRKALRAMGGKILVTLGAYDLLNSKTEISEPYVLRSAIGGAAYREAPPVIPEAAELYFRVPRLMHFYGSIFDKFQAGEGADTVKITLLPDVEGIYGGIIRLFFRSKSEDGMQVFKTYDQFGASEVEDLVRECNRMFEHHKSASGTGLATAKAIDGLVREVNSRYGLVTKKEWTDFAKYYKERRSKSFTARSTDKAAESTRILPGEDMPSSTRPLASDRYAVGLSGAAAAPGQATDLLSANGILGRQFDAFIQFRNSVHSKMQGMAPNFTADFGSRIMQLVKELKGTPDQATRMAVVRRMIQVGGVQTSGSSAGLMLHETYMVAADALMRLLAAIAPLRQATTKADGNKPNKFVAKALNNLGPAEFQAIRRLGACAKIISGGASGTFTVDLSGVRELMRVLMEDLRAFYAKLSPLLPKALAEELRGKDGNAAPGTLRFFEGAVYDAYVKRNTIDLISSGLSRANAQSTIINDLEASLKSEVEQLGRATEMANEQLFAGLFNGLAMGSWSEDIKNQNFGGFSVQLQRAYTQAPGEARKDPWLAQTLADVDQFSRSTMQGVLPMYHKRFMALQQSCDDASAMLGASSITDVLGKVSEGAFAMASACSEILADLGSPAQYMEMSPNAFQLYKSRYGKDPLALLSFAGIAADTALAASGSSPPKSGTNNYKAARGLAPLVFADGQLSWSSFGSMRSLIEEYNSGVDQSSQLSADEVLSFMNRYADALRCMYVSGVGGAALIDRGVLKDKMVQGFTEVAQTVVDPDQSRRTATISRRVGADSVLVEQAIRENGGRAAGVITRVPVGTTGATRQSLASGPLLPTQNEALDKEAAANIIDLNIMPINIHALMRDVYFAELLNYDYTFARYTGRVDPAGYYLALPPSAASEDAAEKVRTEGVNNTGDNIQASADVYVAIRAKLADILSGGREDSRIVRGKELLKGL